MAITYFKRYRMELRLDEARIEPRTVPDDYRFVSWDPGLLEAHADAKYASFRTEIDANVFPCLGDREGCLRLMSEITRKDCFLPETNWLTKLSPADADGNLWCGTIQGIRDRNGFGAIQNLGIAPAHRGIGLGTILMRRALDGFRQAGLSQVYLEVTARNSGAIRLYERIGFRIVRTVYKAAELACSEAHR